MNSETRRSVGKCWLVLLATALFLMGMAATEESIEVRSVEGIGNFTNEAALLIDRRLADEGTGYDDPMCVHWNEQATHFIFDLAMPYRITGLTLQADNNDDYIIEASTDRNKWSRILTISEAVGETPFGMDTFSTVKGDPEYVPSLRFSPTVARYLRLSARGGDEMYAASELQVFGETVQGGGGLQALPTTAVPGAPLKARIASGYGEFFNAAALMIDQRMLPQGTDYNNRSCVHWGNAETYFVIDLGEVCSITGLTVQVDNNDDYLIQVSLDGRRFNPLLTVRGDWGKADMGMDTFSTLPDDPHHVPEMAIRPTRGRFIKISAVEGDGAYSVSEVLLYGSAAPARSQR
jgi:hypothetical protein